MDTVMEDRPYAREGRIIKSYRIKEGITQSHLGKDTGIKVSMVREYEQGRCMPSSERLIRIVNRLGIPMEEFAAVATPEETAC